MRARTERSATHLLMKGMNYDNRNWTIPELTNLHARCSDSTPCVCAGSQAFEFEPKRQVSYANTETNPTMQGALFKPPASSRSNSLLLLPIEGRPPSLVESSVRLRAVTLIQLVNQIPG